MDRSPAELIASVGNSVSSRRPARALVEDLRAVSVVFSPAPPLFRAVLNALQQLKANRKAGEENKAIRHCYQYLSWLANSALLGESEATATLFQLTHDMKDELLPRKLAAVQLFAEIAALYPGASASGADGSPNPGQRASRRVGTFLSDATNPAPRAPAPRHTRPAQRLEDSEQPCHPSSRRPAKLSLTKSPELAFPVLRCPVHYHSRRTRSASSSHPPPFPRSP